jgi:hypothetical protein
MRAIYLWSNKGQLELPNNCIKRLFESKSEYADTFVLRRAFDLQRPLIKLAAVGSGDLRGKLYSLFERQFVEQLGQSTKHICR